MVVQKVQIVVKGSYLSWAWGTRAVFLIEIEVDQGVAVVVVILFVTAANVT